MFFLFHSFQRQIHLSLPIGTTRRLISDLQGTSSNFDIRRNLRNIKQFDQIRHFRKLKSFKPKNDLEYSEDNEFFDDFEDSNRFEKEKNSLNKSETPKSSFENEKSYKSLKIKKLTPLSSSYSSSYKDKKYVDKEYKEFRDDKYDSKSFKKNNSLNSLNQLNQTTENKDFLSFSESNINNIKGFLEFNPYLCSGCGSSFQTKNPNEPGYLLKEKLKQHKERSDKLIKIQESIKMLDLAGIDLRSEEAEILLSQGGVSEDIIKNIKHIGEMLNSKKYSENDNNNNNVDVVLNDNNSNINNNNSTSIFENNNEMIKSNVYELFQMINSNEKHLNSLHTSTLENNEINEVKISTYNNENIKNDNNNLIENLCICQRCFKLNNYNEIDFSLRPGWTNNKFLSLERFDSLLSSLNKTKSVIVNIIDIFDLQGSIIKNLKNISGNNPIVIVVNKIDLLPKDISLSRVIEWLYKEIQFQCHLKTPKLIGENNFNNDKKDNNYANKENDDDLLNQSENNQNYSRNFSNKNSYEKNYNNKFSQKSSDKSLEDEEGILRKANIHLVSCVSGFGMEKLSNSLMKMARDYDNKIHIIGSANVGKSSFVNYFLKEKTNQKQKSLKNHQKTKNLSNKNNFNNSPKVTVSNLPGTTLNFIKMKLSNGITMIDTPGLINFEQLTSRLNHFELKKVIPSKPIKPITLRMSEGKSVMIGGLAIIDFIKGKPFFFTFFISNDIKLHPTSTIKVENVLERIGEIIDIPESKERLDQIGPFDEHIFDIFGSGWQRSSVDICVNGLGFLTVTGSGECTVKLRVARGISVSQRESLLPFEAAFNSGKFTGGRIVS